LLSGVLAGQRPIVAGLAGLLGVGGELTLLVSVTERDGVEGIERFDSPTATTIADRIVAACDELVLQHSRVASDADVAAAHSTWAKRLRVGRDRSAWLLQFRKQ
jgi:hypothetical protein